MNVLVTGSSGYLGAALVSRLRQGGHAVVGIDPVAGSATDYAASIADRALVATVLREHRIEAVLHAGALHKPDVARRPAADFVTTNVQGTLNLLEEATAASASVRRFVFTSTTSVMITREMREARDSRSAPGRARWMTEEAAPLAPRNIYGVTKLAAEHLCRLHHDRHGIAIMVLRTGRFFAEDDDTNRLPSGPNLKANEFLNRRLTVEDAAAAHIAALERAREIGFDTFILSAPPPFSPEDLEALIADAPALIASRFPDAAELYARAGWALPAHIDRVYDPSLAERRLGFRCKSDFASVLAALREGAPLPFEHDPSYVSPAVVAKGSDGC
jgi:nucleoside-diphosphate-sugar epimerase